MAENQDENKEHSTVAESVVEAQELHVNAMSVNELHVGAFAELAQITDVLAQQNKEQLKAILRLSEQNRGNNGAAKNGSKSDTINPNESQNTHKVDISVSMEKPQKSQFNANNTPQKTEIKPDNAKNGISPLQQVESKRRILVINEQERENKRPKATTKGSQQKAPESAKKSTYQPAAARRSRTIDLGVTPSSDAPSLPDVVPSVIASTPDEQRQSKVIEPVKTAANKAGGYYVDAGGRLRRPDGKYASKIELKRYSREQNQNADSGENKKESEQKQAGFLAKAIGILQGKSTKVAETNAADAAGVAAGGSYWIAAKEVGSMASNLRDTFRSRKDKAEKAKAEGSKSKTDKLKSVVSAPFAAAKRVLGGSKDKSGKSGKVATIVPSKSETNYSAEEKEKAADKRTDKQIKVIDTGNQETLKVLEEILEELKPKKKSLLETLFDAGKFALGRRGRGRSGRIGRASKAVRASKTGARQYGRNGKTGKTTKPFRTGNEAPDKPSRPDRVGRNGNREPIDEKYAKARANARANARTTGNTGAVNDIELDKKTGKPITSEVGSRELPSKSVSRVSEKTVTDIKTSEISKGVGKAEEVAKAAPKVGGKAGLLKRPVSAVSKVFSAIPKAFEAVPSVVAASGVLGGKMAPALSTVGGGVKTAGKAAVSLGSKGLLAGARAVPLLGQALSIGLAGYDAYNGYNDTEAQKGIFNLKEGQQANTLQKSSTAAANVLDLGGLTSGLSGLLGDLAGFAGGKNTQEALTFDSGDMAKTMYDSITGESARKAMGVKDGADMSTGQKVSSVLSSVLDLGGLTSFLARGTGAIAEDLGVTGAKKALDFNAGSMANAIYSGTTSAVNKLDFSSDDIVGALDDLIDIVRKGTGTDEGSDTFNNITNWGAGAGGAVASNWSGTAKGVGVPANVQQQEAAAGLPEGYLGGVLGVESGGNPNALNKSGAAGLWQFMPKTVAGMGGFNPLDPVESTQKMIEFTKQNSAYFEKTMGRQASGRELYLMHQQGMGGGTKLMQNPDALASSVVGEKAVLQNGGKITMTARQFAELQMTKFDRQVAANRTAVPLRLGDDGKNGKTNKSIPPMLARPDAQGSTGKTVPPLLARPDLPTATSQSAPVTKSVPTLLQRLPAAPVDIQKQREAKKAAEQAEPAVPLVAKLDPAMTKSLSNIESLLKQQNKAQNSTGTPSGGNSGRNSSVSDHDYVSGHMSDLVRDRG